MRLKVRHSTHYAYHAPPAYLVQRLLLEPVSFASQRVLHWRIEAPGMETALRYEDGFGNVTHLVTVRNAEPGMTIVAEGEVDVSDAAGVVRGLKAQVPDAVFRRVTPATTADSNLRNLAKAHAGKAPLLQRLHALMNDLHASVAYETGVSHAHTTAAEAFADKRGVCQDHAHIMIAVARELGIPARYVTGYLASGIGATSAAAHAWAELLVPDLGWVGFDAANGQCPTDQYVRLAAGIDAAAVTPVRGTRRGGSGEEELTVEVVAEIAQQ